MTVAVSLNVIAVASTIFLFSLGIVVIGLVLRLLGWRWRVLRAPANRLIVMFGVFAAASFYLMTEQPRRICADVVLDARNRPACVYPWIKPRPLQDV